MSHKEYKFDNNKKTLEKHLALYEKNNEKKPPGGGLFMAGGELVFSAK